MAGGQGSGSAFYKSDKKWMEALETPAKEGNAYYILAYQYIAAKLNLWNGAGVTKEVGEAVSAAEAYFMQSPPLPEPTDPQRSELISMAELLDRYNNGKVGPEACE
jgi:hypothetical protein